MITRARESVGLAERRPGVPARQFVLHAAWAEGALFFWGERVWERGRRVRARDLRAATGDTLGKPGRFEVILPRNCELETRGVSGLRGDPAHALEFLSRLREPEGGGSGTAEVEGVGGRWPRIGTDVAFWSRAAKLALELVARQRFAPGLVERGEGLEGRWRPVLDDPRDAERVRALAEAMPDACRAAEPTVGRRALLVDFLGTLVDAAIRSRDGGSWRGEAADSVDRWLDALEGPDAGVTGSPAELRVLREEVESWTLPLRAASAAAPFRTCFRLEEPGTERGRWRLAFEVQASDDPSLRVPARRVWRGEKLVAKRFPDAGERLLADLGRAARLFDPIEKALREATPERCSFSAADAQRFLREASGLLEESGFGVLVPAWWKKGEARLGLRLTVKPASKAAARSGLLGLDSLVAFDWEAALGGKAVSREEFERLSELKVPLVRVRGEWVELRREDLDRALEAMRRIEGGTLGQALQTIAASDFGLPIDEVATSGWVGDLVDAKYEEVAVPAALRTELRPYQKRGLSWLSFLRRLGLGALLADDMGLGKTVEVIAALLAAPREGPTLVVCPTSVLGNWEREIARFGPSLSTRVHHGAGRRARFTGADVVLTSYGTALRDAEALGKVEWDTLVLDEAQFVKNAETKQSRAVRSLRARFRVALTGTPVENRLSDLWSIFEFLNPGYLGPSAAFRKTWALPIERYGDEGRARGLRRLVQPFLLRRVKTDPDVIRDLPEKIETRESCGLTREQATLYRAVVEEMLGRIEGAVGIERRGNVLAALSKLKQVCNHPAHFLKDGSPFPGRSGKVTRLEELLDEVLAEGGRALLFTQFTEFADLLVPHLARRFGRDVLYLHGGTPARRRSEMTARFESPEGPALFVLSLRAGGTGLNLAAANHVFHVDRWWNPAVESQATDRAFRIGQKRNVQVHKFVCRGTLEERIDDLIESKKALAERIVGGGEAWLTELSTRELREVFALRPSAREE
ncbi:MAG TPA: DEAD/DEAH box helicase [Planctomycetota bacterium]|nr:DEAD/DEAH box helicase [Planctomycetota bacterium]